MKLHNYNVTGTQCSVKLAGLKRTYKQIKDNNKKSGNGRSTWVLYSVGIIIFVEFLILTYLYVKHCNMKILNILYRIMH